VASNAAEKRPGPGVYRWVWGALLLLTALTVIAASLHLGRATVAASLGIAAVKSVLVLLYFMHLRWEKRLLLKLLLPITLATLAIFIGLTYSDILVRYQGG
jgi:cytochrome c oxidase subunit 4